MRAAYVAEHSSHEWQDLELNPVVSGTRIFNQAGCSTTNSCYPGTITAANTGGNTNFNSLQTLRRAAGPLRPDPAVQLHLVQGPQQYALEPGGNFDRQQQLFRLSDYRSELQAVWTTDRQTSTIAMSWPRPTSTPFRRSSTMRPALPVHRQRLVAQPASSSTGAAIR